jgi:hypothetical protein
MTTGLEQPSNGEVVFTPGFTRGILAQEPVLNEGKTVLGNVEDGVAGTRATLEQYNEVAPSWPPVTPVTCSAKWGACANDLDTETLASLENALIEFPGCAMITSHDRWFLDRVAPHILAWEGGASPPTRRTRPPGWARTRPGRTGSPAASSAGDRESGPRLRLSSPQRTARQLQAGTVGGASAESGEPCPRARACDSAPESRRPADGSLAQ